MCHQALAERRISMARKRISSSTGFYHVMSRGNNRGEILKKKVDKRKLLKAMGESIANQDIQIYAYCIMNNHYHILIKAPTLEDLGNVMQRINSYYAHYYKMKYGHEGHVFQDRFLSKPLNTISYIANVVRYVHLNPIKAGLVSEIKEYEFSSYREFGCRKSNKIIKNGGRDIVKMLGFKDMKEFRGYHNKKVEINENAKKEIFFDQEEYRYEELLKLKEMERAKVVEMRNRKKNYSELSLSQKREFALLIVNSTRTLSNREISKIAGVGRNKLGKSVPPGPS